MLCWHSLVAINTLDIKKHKQPSLCFTVKEKTSSSTAPPQSMSLINYQLEITNGQEVQARTLWSQGILNRSCVQHISHVEVFAIFVEYSREKNMVDVIFFSSTVGSHRKRIEWKWILIGLRGFIDRFWQNNFAPKSRCMWRPKQVAASS